MHISTDQWHKINELMRRLNRAFLNLGLQFRDDMYPERVEDMKYRCQQQQLRAHVMRQCAGNRRRQGR